MKKFIYLSLFFLLSFNVQERALAGDGMSASSGTNRGSSTYLGISSINLDLD